MSFFTTKQLSYHIGVAATKLLPSPRHLFRSGKICVFPDGDERVSLGFGKATGLGVLESIGFEISRASHRADLLYTHANMFSLHEPVTKTLHLMPCSFHHVTRGNFLTVYPYLAARQASSKNHEIIFSQPESDTDSHQHDVNCLSRTSHSNTTTSVTDRGRDLLMNIRQALLLHEIGGLRTSANYHRPLSTTLLRPSPPSRTSLIR